MKRRNGSAALLSPRLLQIIGLVLLIAAAGFWAYTGRQSALVVGAALSLIGLGSYEKAAEQLRSRLNGRNGGGS